MTSSEISKLNNATKTANENYDNYHTVIKTHTISMGENTMVAEEVKGGQIKVNGSEEFKSYAEMVECLDPNAKIETEVM